MSLHWGEGGTNILESHCAEILKLWFVCENKTIYYCTFSTWLSLITILAVASAVLALKPSRIACALFTGWVFVLTCKLSKIVHVKWSWMCQNLSTDKMFQALTKPDPSLSSWYAGKCKCLNLLLWYCSTSKGIIRFFCAQSLIYSNWNKINKTWIWT